MATEAKAAIEDPTTAVEEGSSCTCGNCDELPDDAKAVVELRASYDENPDEFSHKQTPFLGFEVDSGIHSIIENVWIMGLPTDFSCEGYPELCHPMLVSSDYYAQIVFLKVADAVRFYGLLTDVFGSGTGFGGEGFFLTSMDGFVEEILAEGEEPGVEYFERAIAKTRGEVRFHPEYIGHLRELLDGITTSGELDGKRALLEVAEDLDEAYETLGVDDDLRKLAELECDCGHDH